MTDDTPPKLNSLGVIADRVNAPVHRVAYVLRTRPHIKPTAIAGQARLYSENAIPLIRHEINAIEARRTRGD